MDQHTIASSEHESVGKRDFVLTLDGGGVRGLASLIILEKLMWTINDIASDRGIAGPLLPGDVFCLLVGTSTGGLIATMLGRLNMSVSDCIHAYRNSASKIFGKPNKTGKWSLGFLKARYDGRILHDIVREYACGRRQNPNLSMIRQNYDHEEDASKCAVVCNDEGNTNARWFCSTSCIAQYDLRATVAQATQATTAAPSYFDSVRIGDCDFSDGGLGFNNPSKVVLDHYDFQDARARFTRRNYNTTDPPSENETTLLVDANTSLHSSNSDLLEVESSIYSFNNPSVPLTSENDHEGISLQRRLTIVNIGTGLRSNTSPKRKQDWLERKFKPLARLFNLQHIVLEMATASENTAGFMRTLSRSFDDGRLIYYRLSPDNELCNIGLDAYRQLDQIELLAHEWLRNPSIERSVRNLAIRIVNAKFPGSQR